jgi:hypothetical protein
MNFQTAKPHDLDLLFIDSDTLYCYYSDSNASFSSAIKLNLSEIMYTCCSISLNL